MSQGPRRLIEDPEWGGAFEGLLQEHGKIEGLPGDVRAEVAAMIAASVAGAVGIAAASAAGSAISSAGSAGTATTAAGSLGALGSAGAGATTGGGALGLGSTALGSTALGSTALGSTAGAATALGSAAGAAGALGASGALAAGGASLAAVGLVPKVIAALSLAGAMTAGSVAVVKSTQTKDARSAGVAAEHLMTESEAGLEGANSSTERANPSKVRGHTQNTLPGSIGSDEESPKMVPVAGAEEEPSAFSSKSGAVDPSSQPLKRNTATGLAGEVRLLARARAALAENREYAWTLLNEYQRNYPNGALRAEYEVLVRRVQTTPVDEKSPREDEGTRTKDEPRSPQTP